MQNDDNFLPFDEFKKSLQKRNAGRLLERVMGRQASDAEAERMRSYLMAYYRKLEARQSFIDEDGQVWDCMPLRKQPFMKGRRSGAIKTAPDYPGDPYPELPDTGNINTPIQCPDGHIPVRRITMEKMVIFKNLKEFMQKTAGSVIRAAGSSSIQRAALEDNQHKYVYAKQIIQSKGGGGILSLWQPKVFPANGQIFSLSQIWVIGGTQSRQQVVEVGWQVSPTRWGTDKPVLFIYWTADNYKSTGNYNLEGNAFSQTNTNWKLGGTITPVSSVGGPQFDMIFEWFFINRAWWLYLNKRAVGFYPASLFGGGTLSRFADALLIGGEVSGNNSWSAMGSGLFAEQGLGRSAYIRNAHQMDMSGNIHDMQMTQVVTSPNCYHVQEAQEENWGAAFFYGGPGGRGC